MSLATDFAANLRAAMRLAGLTQQQLAKRSGVHYVTVSRILNGHLDNPTLELCEKLASAAELPREKIFQKVG